MKLGYQLLLILIIPLFALSTKAIDKCHKSTEGTNFWFGFMEGRAIHDNSHYLEITVTAREATTFTIEIGPQKKIVGTFSVNSNSSRSVRSSDLVEATGSETVQNFGIHLMSEKPVNVYALNYNNTYSSDVAIIYPIESLGTEYFAMCYTPTIGNPANDYSSGGRNSEFLVVAILDSTIVKITPSVETDQRQPKGVPFQVVLYKGQVYQVQSKNKDDSSTLNQGDLTGSKIVSDKPVAFYSGSLSTTVPANTCCWDHLYEQIPPVRSWGKEFYTTPLKSRLVDRYRIIASENNTTIYVKNSVVTLNAGGINEFTLNRDEPSRILADKPILVAQFSQSGEADNSNIGDPFMIILSPATQSKNDVTFVAYASSQIKNYFVNIVTLTTEVNSLNLTGGTSGNISIQNQFSPFPGGEYSYAQVTLTSGTYRLWNPDPDKGFLAYVYGFGNVESYGYGVGFNLDLVLDLGKSINFKGDTLLLCYGDSRTLDAGPYFDTYLWNDSTTGQKLTVKEEGKYWALTTTNDGCVLFDSIYIKISHPEIKLKSNSAEGCSPYSVSLAADSGFEEYIWKNELDDTISERPDIILNQTGRYSIMVYNEHQCLASDTFNLKVFEVPVLKIQGDTLVCGDLDTDLEVLLSGADPKLWNKPGSLKWSTKSAKGSFSKIDSTLTKFSVEDYGTYTVNFSVKTSEGCEVTDSINIRFRKTPVSTFDFGEDDKCKGYSKILYFNGKASDEAQFFWDLDGCMFVDTIGIRKYNITVGAFLERQPMISLSINDHGCLSDTTIKPLGANPVYAMEASPTRGCDSLTTTFSCRLLKPDKVEYTWDFGLSDISHDSLVVRKYSQPGFYDVSLMIMNPITQCKNGFTLDSMIQVFATPTAKILVDESVCYPDSLQAIYANNIDSSICNWNFLGAHQSGSGNDSIKVIIDSPTAKISLSVSEFGCLSDTIINAVKRKPHFEIQSDTTEGCQPYSLKVWGFSPDNNLKYTWLIDSITTTKADTAFYYFGKAGKFAIKLFAVSGETQCVDTLIEKDWIKINPKPQANYDVDFPVATIEHPTLTFSNLSSGITHIWDFGDGTRSDLFSPRHTYNQLGDYETSLRITNEFGCPDTSFMTIKIVPFSIYTPNAFRPDSPIEQNRSFMPVGTGADPQRFNIKIFNRWGILVFESDNPEHKWDGKTRNRTDAPTGNYIWIARFFDIQGFEHTQNGQVLLIR
jgi:hypothetical protein